MRLLESIEPQLENHTAEILLLHESDVPLPKPELPFTFRYINIKAKQGIPFNRNKGIEHATHDTLIFIDDDCWTQPKWLDSMLAPLSDPSVLAVTSGTKIPAANFVGNCISSLGFPGGGSVGFEKMWKVSHDGFTNHLAVGNCALRKELFDKVGKFDETMKSGAEDAELSHRMEKAGILIKYVPDAHAFHEARTTLGSFIKWQIRRGRANYQFKQKVGPVGDFIKLRIWSTKNIFRASKKHLFPFIFTFLGLSFTLQQLGIMLEKRKN